MADEDQDMAAGGSPCGDDPQMSTEDSRGEGEIVGSAAMRPIFLGNLDNGYSAADVKEIFERPILPTDAVEGAYSSMPVERVDLKKGYCFVFLKDATSEETKRSAESFVSDINGMAVDRVSSGLRAEFARGDGRVKRKEDDRRKKIQPSETLFVVNFHEETTKREDLQMLFEPFGELVRIDMKRNYAFVQFRSVEEARRAKEVTNGGKLDQSVLTVEYVARQRGEGGGGDRRRDRGRDRGGFGGDRGRGPPPPGYGRRRFDDRYDRGGRFDDRYHDYGGYRGRDRSPPRDRYHDRYRGRSRSRSRSPRYRSRSPRRDHYDDRDRDDRRDRDDYRGRRSPDRDYRGDRGYRP